MNSRMRRLIMRARISVGRALLHTGWKLIGVHVSPGRIFIPEYGEIEI